MWTIFLITLTFSGANSDTRGRAGVLIRKTESRLSVKDVKNDFDGLFITPQGYMMRRRPTSRDSKVPTHMQPAPDMLHCQEGIPPPTRDFRLQHLDTHTLTDYVEIASSVRKHLWLPDLYLPSVFDTRSPYVFVPSKTFRVYQNHTIFANQYLLMKLSCPFNYALFPMDKQICDFTMQSFGFTPCEVNMTWADNMPLSYSPSTLSQFSFRFLRATSAPVSGVFHTASKSPLERSQVHMYIVLKRKIMFYLMQIYIPSALFVVVSWISFLIPAEMAQGRMLLTITTMLTMVSLFAAGSEYVPKASYVKAIDVWMCLCTFLSFSAVVDCLVDVRLESEMLKKKQEEANKTASTFVLTGQARRQTVLEIFRKYVQKQQHSEQGTHAGEAPEPFSTGRSIWIQFLRVCYKVHRAAVVVHPVVFILFNIVYWSVCLRGVEDSLLGEEGVEV